MTKNAPRNMLLFYDNKIFQYFYQEIKLISIFKCGKTKENIISDKGFVLMEMKILSNFPVTLWLSWEFETLDKTIRLSQIPIIASIGTSFLSV